MADNHFLRSPQGHKFPGKTNYGGIFHLNPPEPCGHITNLEGALAANKFLPNPAGGAICIPPGYEVTFKGPGRDPINNPTEDIAFIYEQELVGRQILLRDDFDVPAYRAFGGEFLARYATPGLIESIGLPAWTLLFGTINLEAGPYIASEGGAFSIDPPVTFENSWMLISLAPPFDNDYALQVYIFWRPTRDSGASSGGENARGQYTSFDSLGSNEFRVQSFHWAGEQETAVGGHVENVTVTVSAWWP